MKTQFGYGTALIWAGGSLLFSLVAFWLGKKRFVIALFMVVVVLDMSAYRILVQNAAEALHGESAWIMGKVTEIGYGDRITIKPSTMIIGEESKRVATKIVLDTTATIQFNRAIIDLQVGDWVQFYNTLEAVELKYNEDAVSTMARYKSNGILLFSKVTDMAIFPKEKESFSSRLTQYRENLALRVGGGLGAALLLGDRSEVGFEISALYGKSGLRHMLTFSGAHFAILILLMEKILSVFKVSKRQNAKVMVALSLFIMIFMGLTPPVFRAGIMLIVRYTGILLCRKSDQTTSLLFATFLIVFPKPYLIENTSLILTFTSVLGIGIFGEMLIEVIRKSFGKLGEWSFVKVLATTLGTSIAAQTLMTPFLFVEFGQIATYTILSNFLLFGIQQVMFVLAGLLFITFDIKGLWMWLSTIFTWLQNIVESIMEKIVNLPFSTIYQETGATIFLYEAILVIFVLALFYWKKRGMKPLQTILAVGLLVMSFAISVPKLTEETYITFLDVGQGEAVVVTNRGKTFVFDCGTTNSNKAGQITLDYLDSKNIKEIEAVVISHTHYDHAGGVEQLLYKTKVNQVVLPKVNEEISLAKSIVETAQKQGVPVFFAEDVDILYEEDDFEIQIITEHFDAIKSFSDEVSNEKSAVSYIRRGESSVLLTGDIGREGEAELLKRGILLDADVLKVAHHGSAYSSTGSLLSEVTPSIAVVEVGKDNTYGHPTVEALQRISYFTEHIYRTDLRGQVELFTTGDGIFWVGLENGNE